MLLAICTTHVAERVIKKRNKKKITKQKQKQKRDYENFALRGFEPGPSQLVRTKS